MSEIQVEVSKTVKRNTFCSLLKFAALKMLYLVRLILDKLIDTLFGLYYDSQQLPLAKARSPIVLESATSLARKIRQRQLTVEEVVTAFIDRINSVNSLLNAVVDERFKEAVAEARQLDKAIQTGQIQDVDFQTKPLLGVPFTTKESTAAQNMSHTFGLLKRKGKTSNFDADVVEKVKNAGGILLGVTNVPQLNLWQETNNPVYGLTRNPYNNTRNVGGSSGGESSIIAAGGSPLGIGTDIGGSLRIPAFMCGIFGHKPTSDLISTHGLTFRTGKEKGTMVVAGPMTRYAEDLTPVLKVLVGPQNLPKLKLDHPVNVEDVKIFFVVNPNDPLISSFKEEMNEMFRKVIDYLRDIVKEAPCNLLLPEMKDGGKLWRYWMTQEPGANFNRDLTNREGEVKTVGEIIKYIMGKSEFNAAVILNLLNSLLPGPNTDWVRQTTESLRNKLIEKLGPNGVLIYPSAPWPASYHYTALLRPWNFYLFAIWNALKFPVTQIPMGLNDEGLPLGIQVVSAPYQDHLCIAVAKELEKGFGGYVPPFKLETSSY